MTVDPPVGRGAVDENAVWKAHAGRIAWPTLTLATVVIGGHVLLWLLATYGGVSAFWLSVPAALLAYLAFTVAHEACHGNIHGSGRRLRGLGTGLGWCAGLLLLVPFPLFRVLHLRHHSHTNHPEKDPDYWVRGTGLRLLWRAASVQCHYAYCFFRGEASQSTAAKRAQKEVLLGVVILVALLVGLTGVGLGTEVLLLWVVPAAIASFALALLFDWWPHHPHQVQGRYRDTRATAVFGLGLPTLGQNLHLIHHLYPRVPFYNYHRVFRILRSTLEEKGAPIQGWRSDPRRVPSTSPVSVQESRT